MNRANRDRHQVSAADYLPEHLTPANLRNSAAHCHGCDLYRTATQTVFGEGGEGARVMLIGEQPGDREDRLGHPFVGPAGRVLVQAASDAGIDPASLYVTNAVKHFKWELRGKRRIHKRPRDSEISACRPWLVAEVKLLQPQVVVCLGAVAAQACFGKKVRIRDYRGRFSASLLSPVTFVTLHPSAVLRITDDEQRHHEYGELVKDLRLVQSHFATS